MLLSSWLPLTLSRSHARSAKRRQLAARPNVSLERLEDRILLSAFTVLNLKDSGAGSLRAAVAAANANPGADSINFAHGLHGTIPLTSGELQITDSLTINGPGANSLAVSGSNTSRVFEIGTGSSVSIERPDDC